MHQGEDSTTSDTLVHHVQRSVENVTDAGFEASAVQKVGNSVSTLLVTVSLGADIAVRHTGATRSET